MEIYRPFLHQKEFDFDFFFAISIKTLYLKLTISIFKNETNHAHCLSGFFKLLDGTIQNPSEERQERIQL